MKKLSALLLVLGFLVSCQGNDDTDPISSEEAIAAIEEAAELAANDIIDLAESEGVAGLEEASEYLFYLTEYGANFRHGGHFKNYLKGLTSIFSGTSGMRVMVEEPNPQFPTGIFEWSAVSQGFDFVEESENWSHYW